jgi:dCMP deaminase
MYHIPALRPSWDQYFIDMCMTVSERSIDQDTKVGAVIANANHRVVSTGYNAFPAGVMDSYWPTKRGDTVRVPHFDVPEYGVDWVAEGRFYTCDKYAAICHAEENAIVAAGQDLHGCTLYSSLFPCANCSKLAITAGIKRIVYLNGREDVSWAVAKTLLNQAGVTLSQFTPTPR